jgi:hypothetical protein
MEYGLDFGTHFDGDNSIKTLFFELIINHISCDDSKVCKSLFLGLGVNI